MAETASRERRRFERIRFEGEVRLEVGPEEHACRLLDISLRGMLLEDCGGWQAAPGTSVVAALALDEQGTCQIRIRGQVAHCRGRVIGIHFRDMDIDSGTNLRRLVEMNLADPRQLDRELRAMILDNEGSDPRDAPHPDR